MSLFSSIPIFLSLAKVRMTFFILVSVAFGFFYSLENPFNLLTFLGLMVGSGLFSTVCFVFNQVLEVPFDALMNRTKNRPLPKQKISKRVAIIFGLFCFVTGILVSLKYTDWLTTAIGIFIVFSYLFIYTPLKRKTYWNTLIGGVPGSLPPVMGYTAALNPIDEKAVILFFIWFFWQIPHFLALAFMYKGQYQQAGYKMLASIDNNSQFCLRQIVVQTLLLAILSVAPYYFQWTNLAYLIVVVLAGSFLLFKSIQLYRQPSFDLAKEMFKSTLLYLPLLMVFLFLGKN